MGAGSHSTGNMAQPTSGRRKSSKKRASSSEDRKKSNRKKRGKIQPGQGVLLNNFFPALESGSGQNKKASAEEYAAVQQAM
jgi:hypothetical protein